LRVVFSGRLGKAARSIPLRKKEDSMDAVFTNRIVHSGGRVIGRICLVYDGDGFYKGSYYEQVIEVPQDEVGHCRKYGINSRLLNLREWAENDGPRQMASFLDDLPSS
jgi:hypothetical protein